MSKNADPPLLPSADPSAPHMANADQRAALTAALLREVDPDLWQEFCRRHPESIRPLLSAPLAETAAALPPITEQPEGPLALMLTAEHFAHQISREILLLARTGGELSLLCAAVCGSDAASDGSLMAQLWPRPWPKACAPARKAATAWAAPGRGVLPCFCPAWGVCAPACWRNKCVSTLPGGPQHYCAAPKTAPRATAPWASPTRPRVAD